MTDKPATKEPGRCAWAGNDPLNVAYHDQEWGVPQHDENRLFEMLTLEGAQAGLSWLTILRKREGYRQAFEAFDVRKVAVFDAPKMDELVINPAIVRHRGKIESTVNNAQRILDLWAQGSSLNELTWQSVAGKTVHNRWQSMDQLPAQTEASKQLSQRLKKAGFRFVGPTTCYAFMQAAGIVNDHELQCFRYSELSPD